MINVKCTRCGVVNSLSNEICKACGLELNSPAPAGAGKGSRRNRSTRNFTKWRGLPVKTGARDFRVAAVSNRIGAMYSAQITRANPTCIILLIDQSGSMGDPFSGDSARKKADFVSEVVNHTLHDLVIRCTKTEEVRNYYHVSVIGYGRTVGTCFSGELGGRPIVPISQVADYPLQVKSSYKRVSDGAGGWVEIPVRYPVWIHPSADGKTPMCEALGRVQDILRGWLMEHPRGFPPTVLHLTDGESSDGDPNDIGRQIMSLGTDDGAVLLFNCHISTRRSAKIEYPTEEISLPDGFARSLFEISSTLPTNFLAAAAQLGVNAVEGSRGFVFNGDPSSIVQFYEIGTSLTGMTPYRWMDDRTELA